MASSTSKARSSSAGRATGTRFAPSNKICARKWDAYVRKQHKQRIATVQGTIDTSAPPKFDHLKVRRKRDLQRKKEYERIQKENELLLEKMKSINRRRGASFATKTKIPKPRSLNEIVRKKEARRILRENRGILERITTQKPYMDKREWKEHSKKHAYLKRSIREHKPPSRRRHRHLLLEDEGEADAADLAVGDDGAVANDDDVVEDEMKRHEAPRSRSRSRRRRGAGSRHVHRGRRRLGGHREEPLERVLLKECKNLKGKQFVVITVIETHLPHTISIRTFDLDTSKALRIDVPFDDLELRVDDRQLLQDDQREVLAAALIDCLRIERTCLELPDAIGFLKK